LEEQQTVRPVTAAFYRALERRLHVPTSSFAGEKLELVRTVGDTLRHFNVYRVKPVEDVAAGLDAKQTSPNSDQSGDDLIHRVLTTLAMTRKCERCQIVRDSSKVQMRAYRGRATVAHRANTGRKHMALFECVDCSSQGEK
jgi:MoxR-like ATPase